MISKRASTVPTEVNVGTVLYDHQHQENIVVLVVDSTGITLQRADGQMYVPRSLFEKKYGSQWTPSDDCPEWCA
ncbi:hypothetical protein [Halococcus sp. PRR34]|uniref:hypothetical protein n=1 Tax=Halococcus sp. PRR34 TaxID=3020830 RepID=UPI00236007CB|nr:hypothetical protein [Halococcus sp. PRR34]